MQQEDHSNLVRKIDRDRILIRTNTSFNNTQSLVLFDQISGNTAPVTNASLKMFLIDVIQKGFIVDNGDFLSTAAIAVLDYLLQQPIRKSLLKELLPQSNYRLMPENKFLSQFDNKSFTHKTPFNIIWAVTPHCNLECIYCYPSGYHKKIEAAPKENSLFQIADKIIAAQICQVAIGGGEPLLLGVTLLKLCQYLHKHAIQITVLTNGLLLNESMIDEYVSLSEKGGFYFTLSLDGHLENIHEKTRGKGFDKILETMLLLKARGLPFFIETVVNKHNVNHISDIVALADRLGAVGILFMALSPFGSPKNFLELLPTLEQEWGAVVKIQELSKQYDTICIDHLELSQSKPQINNSGRVMGCRAGERFCFIAPNGSIFPCPAAIDDNFLMGNIINSPNFESIFALYDKNPYCQIGKKQTKEISGCQSCIHSDKCTGGCRGEAWFIKQDIEARPFRCAVDRELVPRVL